MPSLLVLVFAVIIDVARATADDAAEIGATVDRVDTRPLEFQELLTTDIPCSIQRYASVRDGVAAQQTQNASSHPFIVHVGYTSRDRKDIEIESQIESLGTRADLLRKYGDRPEHFAKIFGFVVISFVVKLHHSCLSLFCAPADI